MPEAPVTPEVVRWAIDESGLSVAEVAERLTVEPSAVSAWARGSAKPSKGQLTKLAKNLKRPRAMFFLPEAPVASSLPDGLRTVAGASSRPRDLSFDERIQVRRTRRLQEFLSALIETPPVLPAAARGERPEVVGEQLRNWIGVNREAQQEWKTASQAFTGWRKAIQAKGVAVLALPLRKDGIRGFALGNERAPMIAVNTADIPEARCFTLFHELAHLVLRDSVSCAAPGSRAQGLEQWCDRVASNALIPRAVLREATEATDLDPLALVKRIANRFKVSRRATAIALEEIGAVEGAYALVETEWPHIDREKKGGGGGGGQTAPKKRTHEYGGLVVGAIIRALNSGRINEMEASDHLRLDRTCLPEITST